MPSLKEVAQIIREDNDVIINNQDKQTESLDGINKNFDKFFTLQERDKLDRFERRKEEDRKRPRGAGAARTGAMAGIAAGAGLLFNPAALLKAMLNPKILLGIVGVLAIKPAFAALRLAAQGLTNLIDDAAKTQRGLNRFNAKELENKEKAAAKAAKAEEARLKTEEKLATQRARQAQAEMVKARAEEQRQIKAKAADAEARAKASEIARQAEINYSKSLEESENLRKQKLIQQDVRATALRNADLAREIRGMRGGFLKGRLDLQTDAVRALAETASDAPNRPNVPTSPSGPDLPGGLGLDTGSAIKPMGLGEVTTSVETPSQRATRLLMANQDAMKAAGFEPVKMQNGAIRFVEAGRPGVFVSAENVLDLTNRQKAQASASIRPGYGQKVVVGATGALLAADIALGMAEEVKRAAAENRTLKQAEIESAGFAQAVTAPIALVQAGVNALAAGIEKVQEGFGIVPSGERLDILTPLTADIRKDVNKLQETIGVGQGEASPNLVDAVTKFDEGVDKAIDYLTGKDKENELAVEDVMRQYGGFGTTPQAPLQFNAPTIDNSVNNVSNTGFAISGPSGAGDKSHLRSRIGND